MYIMDKFIPWIHKCIWIWSAYDGSYFFLFELWHAFVRIYCKIFCGDEKCFLINQFQMFITSKFVQTPSLLKFICKFIFLYFLELFS